MNAVPPRPVGSRRALLVRSSIVAVWLLCLVWLVRTEIAPERFGGTVRGYGALIGTDVLSNDTWMRVIQDGKPVGYSHSSLLVDEEASAAERITLQNTLHLSLTVLGERRSVQTQSTVNLDDWSRLTRFSFDATFAEVSLRAFGGRRPSDGRFDVTLSIGGKPQRMTVEIPDDAILYFPMGDTLARRLRPGRRVTVNTLDPTTLRTAPLTLEALREETLELNGVRVPTVVVSARTSGITVLSWIDAAGNVVRAETPFGWSLERCTADEAFATLR